MEAIHFFICSCTHVCRCVTPALNTCWAQEPHCPAGLLIMDCPNFMDAVSCRKARAHNFLEKTSLKNEPLQLKTYPKSAATFPTTVSSTLSFIQFLRFSSFWHICLHLDCRTRRRHKQQVVDRYGPKVASGCCKQFKAIESGKWFAKQGRVPRKWTNAVAPMPLDDQT